MRKKKMRFIAIVLTIFAGMLVQDYSIVKACKEKGRVQMWNVTLVCKVDV